MVLMLHQVCMWNQSVCVQAPNHMRRAPTAVLAADDDCWDATVQAFTAICELMKMFLTADASACPTALRDGSWDAGGVQEITYAICASCSAARHLGPCLPCLVIVIMLTSWIIDHAMVTVLMAYCCTWPGVSSRRECLLSSGAGNDRRCCVHCRLCWNVAAELLAAQRQRVQTLSLRQSVPCKNCWCALQMLPVQTPCCCWPLVANASKLTAHV